MKYRMHKRIETKPDGRTIYYYTFEPAETQERETPAEPDPEMLATLKATHARLEAAGHRPTTPEEVLERIEAERASWEKEMPERAETHLP